MRQAKEFSTFVNKETGQSIVLIAVVMVALLGFVGLAIDLGLVWVRRAQLTAAVDAAALAGVTEIETAAGWNGALAKAKQFLYSNDIPAWVITPTVPADPEQFVLYDQGSNAIGATEFTVTATWPVELYFMRLLGFDEFRVSHSATAAYFPLVDIYASRRVELGTLDTSNQAVFGPECVTANGDPFSAFNSSFRPSNHYVNPAYSSSYFSYRYRILIPPDYEAISGSNIVRVELFDPDTFNYSEGSANWDLNAYVFTHTISFGNPPTGSVGCVGNDRWRWEPCILPTGENIDLNPFWFIRIDEVRSGNNSSCGNPSGDNYSNGEFTQTGFDLYYYRVNSLTGLIEPVPISQYTGRGDNNHDTDMRWVSPGGELSYDQTVNVPANFGSFEVNLDNISDILRDQTTNNRYIYLDVTALTGATENGYEIWAGPPHYTGPKDTNTPNHCGIPDQIPPAGTPSKANERNLHVVNCGRNSHSSMGATVLSMGNLPMNSNTNNPVDIPLIYVGAEYAGSQILISLFDSDSGAEGPIVFFFDTLAYTLRSPIPAPPANPVNTAMTDWALAFSVNNTTTADPDLASGEARNCRIGNCQNLWISPAYRIQVPTLDPTRCVNQATTPQWCTPFYGGRLTARYDGGNHDTYGWQIRLPGLPYLIK